MNPTGWSGLILHSDLFIGLGQSVSEEPEIYTDYNGYHRHHVKHDSYLSAHFSSPR
jgi:hypothetical protein